MTNAVSGLSDEFLTPMAAVAGSIAEEVVVAGWGARGLRRLWVNNGGDIAFRIADGETVSIGVVADVNAPSIVGRLVVDASSPVRGVATSGWGGRSWSLGIADAVTILARQASIADAAATAVANTVDLPGHPAVRRAPARSLDDNSDLGDLLVTTGVGDLSPHEVRVALDAGESEAKRLMQAGVIEGAVLCLKGGVRLLGAATPMTGESPRSDAPRK